MKAVCLILLGALVALTSGQKTYPHTKSLNANYKLAWEVNATHIEFRTEVATTGWAGFGISVNGSMFPGDVVIGFYNHNKPVFNDYHTTGHMPPTLDRQQDWTLLSASNANQKLICTFVRALDTGDKDDLAIQTGRTHVIWAYSDNKATSVPYHDANRGSVDIGLVHNADIIG